MKVKLATMNVKAGPDDGLEEGEFRAYASTWIREPDSYGDVVAKGAFTDTLKEWEDSTALLPLLFAHRMDDPDFNIGHIKSAVEDDHGLLVEGVLDLESPKAAQVYRMLKGRRLNQLSFAYDVLEGGDVTLDGDVKAYELRKMKIHEVSLVPLGANQDTEVLAVKAMTDTLVQRVKAGRVLSGKNETALREVLDVLESARTSLTDVLKAVEADEEAEDEESTETEEEASGTPADTDTGQPQDRASGTGTSASQDPKASPSVDAKASFTALQEFLQATS